MSLSCIKPELFRSHATNRRPAACRTASVLYFLIVGWCLFASPLNGETVLFEDFEGPQTCWQLGPANTTFQVLSHQRVRSPVHSGSWSESIRIFGHGGSYVYATSDIGRAQVIDELALSVWLRSNHPGLQLAARVVLPRTQDLKTGKPMTLRVYGEQYQNVGRWQQISLDNISQRVMRQARIMRSGDGKKVDHREAYIDRILINVYGGPGVTDVWVDDLEIEGFVGDRIDPVATARGQTDRKKQTRPSQGSLVELRDSQLTLAGKPFFPLIVQYQGEPFAYLKSKGFNTIWLPQPPTADQILEAKKNNLWLLCPPLRSESSNATEATTGRSLETDRVLAWYDGSDSSKQKTKDIAGRPVDRFHKWKPTVGHADQKGPLAPFDITLLKKCPIGTSLEMEDYAAWLETHVDNRSKRKVYWNTVKTQRSRSPGEITPTEKLKSEPTSPPRGDLSYTELRCLVMESLIAGVRGLVFLSDSPLNGTAPEAKRRAVSLELINLELNLIHPLLAANQIKTPVRCHPNSVVATAIQIDHVHLILPTIRAGGSQYVGIPAPKQPVTFVIPGIPDTVRAFALSPLGLTTASQQRIAGGTRITLPRLDPMTLLLLSTDRTTIRRTARQLAAVQNRARALFSEIVLAELESLTKINRQLRPLVQTSAVAHHIAQAKDLKRQASEARRAKDYRHAYQLDCRAFGRIGTAQRRLWKDAVELFGPPTRLASLTSFETLPAAYNWPQVAAHARLGENLLPSGKMELPQELLSAPWQTLLSEGQKGTNHATISETQPHGGRGCMQIHARGPSENSALSGNRLLTVQSPQIPIVVGHFYEIRLWVRAEGLDRESENQLLFYDSIGGPDLATRRKNTSTWEPVTVYRQAAKNEPLKIFISLQGSGDVWVDDITVRKLSPSIAPHHSVLANPAITTEETP